MKNIVVVFLALILIKVTAFFQVLPQEPQKQPTPIIKPNQPKKPTTATTNINPLLNMKIVQVQGGTFTMGCTFDRVSECYDNEEQLHQVTVGYFNIMKYYVNQAQWIALVSNNLSENKGSDKCPVTSVSWNEVQDFIKELNFKTGKQYRLLPEAEWEYAARGGNQSRGYKYAGSNDLDKVSWYIDRGAGTHPVVKKQPNELGLYDMTGNVAQWCNGCYGNYASEFHTKPQGPSSSVKRVIRGGSIHYFNPVSYFVAFSEYNSPDDSEGNIGFRFALSQ